MKMPTCKKEMIKFMLVYGNDIIQVINAIADNTDYSVLDEWFLDNWSWLHQDFGLTFRRDNNIIIEFVIGDTPVYYIDDYNAKEHTWKRTQELYREVMRNETAHL